MRILIGNAVSQLVVGGRDNLLPYDLMKELREYFSIPVKGAYFSDKYRRHVWDGRKYYLTEGGKLPTGFIPYLFKWLDGRPEVEVELVDGRTNLMEFQNPPVLSVGSKTLRDYQEDTLRSINRHITLRGESVYFPMGVFDIATNGGKTLIAYSLFKNIVGCRLLITIHMKDVFNQLVRELTEEGEDVGVINDRKVCIKPITVAMVGTLYNRMKGSVTFRKDMQQFNTLIVDEGHAAGAKQYAWVIKSLDSAGVRVVMSGTPLDQADETKSLTVVGVGSTVVKEISKKFLMDMGVSQRAKVYIHLNNIKLNGDVKDYDYVYTQVVKYSAIRIQVIRDIIQRNPDKYILMMVYEVDHAQFVYDSLSDMDGVSMVHGTDPDRVMKLDMFRTGDIRVLIATEIVKIGLNLPLINILILLMGEKSKVDILQFSGRGERNDGEFTEFEIHDFFDVGRYVSQHSLERVRIYRKEEFSITFMYPSTSNGTPKIIG